jgi:hypothetical protein
MIRLRSILEEIDNDNQKAMVTGVAEILRGVNDMVNRKELAMQMIDKFKRESVPFNMQQFLTMCDIPASAIYEADSPTERTRRYNRKNKKKVRAYLRKTQDDRVARNGDRAKAVKKHGKAKLKGKDVHHPNGAQNGNWRVVKGDHGPDKKK